MRLHTFNAPNPFRVHVFVAEKHLDIDRVTVDLMQGEHRQADFLARNSLGELPVLELDDGTHIAESVAICRYLEALYPDRPLFGSTPRDAALIDMWIRRMELRVAHCIGEYARHTFEFFRDSVDQHADYAASMLKLLDARWAWLDGELGDGRTYVSDDRFSMADIVGMSTLLICDYAKHEIPSRYAHVKRWEAALRARPSFVP